MREAGTEAATVSEYADAMRDGATFPPVTLYADGTLFYVSDGFHRVEAARQAGREAILAEVREGTRREAILAAAAANATHGLRRTQADKRKAVATLLRDPEWTKWSDREIGRACAVDHKTVARVRSELTGEIPSVRTYTDRHGNQTQMRINGGGGGNGAGSVLDKVLSRVSDEALIAECKRRGLEVGHV